MFSTKERWRNAATHEGDRTTPSAQPYSRTNKLREVDAPTSGNAEHGARREKRIVLRSSVGEMGSNQPGTQANSGPISRVLLLQTFFPEDNALGGFIGFPPVFQPVIFNPICSSLFISQPPLDFDKETPGPA